MPILFDSDNALLGVSVPPIPGEPFGVVRDWVGHIDESFNIDAATDFTWSGTSRIAVAGLEGPYDVDNQIYVISGTDSLDAPASYTLTSGDIILEVAAWVRFDDVPTPTGSDFEFPFILITDNGTGGFLEVVFLFKTDNTVVLRARFSNDGIVTHESTHPDNMARTDWLFFSVLFDHHPPVGDVTIAMDPGNDNVVESHPDNINISAKTYDTIKLCTGPGQSPGNLKGIRFSNVMVLRVTPEDPGGLGVTFDTPGSHVYEVPAGVTELVATMWAGGGGGGGGGSMSFGGFGAGSGFTKATHAVTPAETLQIEVGAFGSLGVGASPSADAAGGGGSSTLHRTGGTVLLQATAAGGGGGGGDNSSSVAGGNGGAGGGTTGIIGGTSGASIGGGPGTPTAGGAGGTGENNGEAGASFFGGRGANGQTGLGSGGAGGLLDGGAGGDFSTASPGFAGGGGGGGGFFGGGGSGSSVSGNAGGGGGGGGSSFIIGSATSTTNTAGSGRTPGGTGDPTYVADSGRGGDTGGFTDDGFDGEDGFVRLVHDSGGGTWRQTIRDFTLQEEFDEFQVTHVKAVRLWRCSEWNLGGTLGDRYIHDISGFLNPGTAATGELARNIVDDHPLDTDNSYLYTEGCAATTDNTSKSLQYVKIRTWDLTWFCFFREPASVVNDGDWFIRFENDAGEFIQLERDGTTLTRRVQLATGGPIVHTSVSTPLFDGDWHRLVMTAHETVAGNWDVAVDGTRYFPDVTPEALSAPMTRIRWGNIDVNLAVMGWANYFDADIYTTFTSLSTELAVRQYIEARTDTPPGDDLSDYYGGYYPMQNQIVGTG